MVTHKLKTWPKYFRDVITGKKQFEIRKDDRGMRGFKVGDLLILQEFCPETNSFTGNEARVEVTYVTSFNQRDGYVVMGIELIL